MSDVMFDTLMRDQRTAEIIRPVPFSNTPTNTTAEPQPLDVYEQAVKEFKDRPFLRELNAYFEANPIVGVPGDYLMRRSTK